SKTIPRKVAFAERNGKPTHSALGKADDIGEETGTSTRWDRRGRGPGIWGRICRDRVGKNPLAAGAGSNLQRLSERREEPKGGRARRVWRMSPYELGTGSNVLGGGGLVCNRRRPGGRCLAQLAVVVVGHDDDCGGWIEDPDLSGGCNPVYVGHPDVQEHDI